MPDKNRLDAELVIRGICNSRTKAKEHITNGFVTVNGKPITKASFLVDEQDEIISTAIDKFVGRGGYKIEAMMECMQLSAKDCVAMDVGASTGGFTQCLLNYGAKTVYSIDVGHGQLHESLRNDNRVINLESTDIRDRKATAVIKDNSINFCSVDVSFISLNLVLPSIQVLLADNADLICLIKPQFEVGKANIGKNGIVKDKKAQIRAIQEIVDTMHILHLSIKKLIPSPIKGGDGNAEFLVYAKKTISENKIPSLDEIKAIVAQGNAD